MCHFSRLKDIADLEAVIEKNEAEAANLLSVAALQGEAPSPALLSERPRNAEQQ
jgi:hypothetical protein